MIQRVAIDVPVLAAAVLPDDPAHAAAQMAVTGVEIGAYDLAIPAGSVVALVRVLTRRTGARAWAGDRGADLARMGALLDVAGDDVALGLDLLERHPAAGARAAFTAAVLRRHGVHEMISDDRRFDALPGLARIAVRDALGPAGP